VAQAIIAGIVEALETALAAAKRVGTSKKNFKEFSAS